MFQALTVFAVGIVGGMVFGKYREALWERFGFEGRIQWSDWATVCEKVKEEEEEDCACGDDY